MNPLRVLYMDDDATLASLVQQRLEATGLRVDHAANGESGLIMHRVRSYDVLLISQELPVRSGLDVVWTLSAKQALPAAIMLARNGDAQTAVQALKLGVGDYIIKDEDDRFLDVLPGCVQQVVRDRRDQDEKDRLINAFRQNQSQLEESNLALLRMAAMDGLTGIANRRLFDEVLDREWRRAIEQGTTISLILTDVDRFKAYNDIYGHLAGDDCLKRVAKVIGNAPERKSELAARYGGEEFAVILVQRGDADATAIAERVRRGVEGLRLRHQASEHNEAVTVSMGVVTTVPTQTSTIKELIEAADNCLYRAKEAGRNWIVSADLTRRRDRRAGAGRSSADSTGNFRPPVNETPPAGHFPSGSHALTPRPGSINAPSWNELPKPVQRERTAVPPPLPGSGRR